VDKAAAMVMSRGAAVIAEGRSTTVTSAEHYFTLVSVDLWPDSGVFPETGGVSDLAVLDVDDAIVREIWKLDAPQGEATVEDTISDKTGGRGGKTLGKPNPGLF
jgi:hypothetical protein